MLDIAAESLTKDFGRIRAVDDVSFEIQPGRVVGLLGPNGSGKTTTLRMLLGLVSPTAGRTMIGGRPFAALDGPAHHVGVVLEAGAFHGGRTARNHLRVLATEAGIARRRVGEVLELVGLTEAADRRAGTFSLGMGQRLSLAAALLGDPGVLILDEPANGLDPAGIRWLRRPLARPCRRRPHDRVVQPCAGRGRADRRRGPDPRSRPAARPTGRCRTSRPSRMPSSS